MYVDGSRPHILGINDSQEILDLLRDILKEEGYRVTTRTAALPTPDEIAALQPDLVILDYIWGTEDSGWSLLHLLRDDLRTRDLPVILCTGAIRQLELVRDQLPAMQVTLVLKAFDIDDLVRTVSEVLAEDEPGAPDPRPGG